MFGSIHFTVRLYQQSHQGLSPPDNPYNPEWVRWRPHRISKFINKIAQKIREIRPNCTISLSPNLQNFAYRSYLQDWQTWVQQGWIDELVLQVYRNNASQIQAELSQVSVQTAKQRIPVAIGLLSGVWRNPIEIARVQAQVNLVRRNGFDGVSFFYWESLMGYFSPESPYQRQQVLQEMFASS